MADLLFGGSGRPKRTDLDLSKVFVGTCPDMCPEKERYMRETRNQLSAYEVVPNTEMVKSDSSYWKFYDRTSQITNDLII